MVGRDRGKAIFSGALHLLSTGNSDFLQNYYINPTLSSTYTADQFSEILLQSYAGFVQVSLCYKHILIALLILSVPFLYTTYYKIVVYKEEKSERYSNTQLLNIC